MPKPCVAFGNGLWYNIWIQLNMVKTKTKAIVVICAVMFLCLNTALIARAAVTDLKPVESVTIKEKAKRAEDGKTQNGPTIEESGKVLKNAMFLIQLQDQLKQANSSYQKNAEVFNETKKRLGATQEQVATLKDQIAHFDEVINYTNEKIKTVSKQIYEYNKSLAAVYNELETYKIAYQEQKQLLENYVRMLYKQENQYLSFEDNGEISAVKLLLADNSVSDTLQSVRYLGMLEQTGQNLVQNIARHTADIQNKQQNLEEQKSKLDDLRDQLQNEKDTLQEQKIAKAMLLKETHGEEEIYRGLVAQYLQDQEDVLAEISALRDNMKFIDKKLREMGSTATIADLKTLVDENTAAIYEFQNSVDPNAVFNWPVKPSRGLSAYFRDSAYRATFGIPHNAIDIPTPQGTTVFAPRDGYVYKIKDNGMGYSYLIMTHSDGFMTVYGHVIEFIAKEGQFVKAGEPIALSGGMPGTKGAGAITTGPHLHLEILKDGVYQDPLDYLSLLQLPLENIPSKYSDRLMKEKIESGAQTSIGPNETPVTEENIESVIEENAKKESDMLQRLQNPIPNARMKP